MMVLLLACTNTMKATRDAPFSLGSLKSALFAESRWSNPDSGSGAATILLVDQAGFSCKDFADELNGFTEPQDSVTWKASGAVVELEWWNNTGANIGWEGDYYQGAYSYSGYYYYDYTNEDGESETSQVDRRNMASAAFADERVYQGSYLFGRLTIDSGDADSVSGSIQTEWWKAKFEAENCGQVGDEGPSDGDDVTDEDDEDEPRDTG